MNKSPCFDLNLRAEYYNYNIRSNKLFHANKTRTKMAENSLRNVLPKLLNETSHSILDKIANHSFEGYNFFTNRTIIDQYNITCTLHNCYISYVTGINNMIISFHRSLEICVFCKHVIGMFN